MGVLTLTLGEQVYLNKHQQRGRVEVIDREQDRVQVKLEFGGSHWESLDEISQAVAIDGDVFCVGCIPEGVEPDEIVGLNRTDGYESVPWCSASGCDREHPYASDAPDWRRCSDPTCPGWIHCNDPREIERCDRCTRFDSDEDAQKAHAAECGCDWEGGSDERV